MIVTLTINPAVDRTLGVDRLAFDDRAYIQWQTEAAGGRGIQASRVIHTFGAKTLAITLAGGASGEILRRSLAKDGFPVRILPIAAEVRTNFIVTDRHGLTVKLNEYGPALTAQELRALEEAVKEELNRATWLMLCGSLPRGVPGDFYKQLILAAREKGVKVLLDTDGEALFEGLEARPTIVAPNQQEAERLLSQALLTRGHFLAAARKICAMGAESIILSLGSRGAVGVRGDEQVEVTPPPVDAISPIGAGDALAAAAVWALEQGATFEEAVRWGVASGTASAMLPGIQFAPLADCRVLYQKVEVKRLA